MLCPPSNAGDVWGQLTVEAQNEIMAGALAIRRIREHEDYTRWVQVGRALLRLQEEALYLTRSNAPHGRAYTRMRAELGRRVPDLERVHNTSKAHAVWLAKNYEAVETWRATLAANQREQLNHPSVLKRRFEAATTIATAARPAADKTAIIAAQEERIDALERQTSKVAGDQFNLKADPPRMIARILIEEISITRAEGLVRALTAQLKAVKRAAAQAPAPRRK